MFENCFSTKLEANIAKTLSIKRLFKDYIRVVVATSDPLLETQLLNNIRVYGNKDTVIQISRLVNEFLLIWELSGFVQILFKR